MRRLTVLLLLVMGAGLLPLTSAFGASGNGITIRLLEAPKGLENDPRARSYIIDNVTPGTTFTRRIGVSSSGAQAATVLLYAAPATVEKGGFLPGRRGETTELSSWMDVSPRELTLTPGQEQAVTVTVRVPADAPNGERYGAIFAELPPPAGGTGIAIASRVGIRVYLSVSNSGAPKTDFTVDSLTAARDKAGAPFVTAAVHNTGGRALDMSGTLRLADGPGALTAGPFPADLGTTLAPGQTEPVTIKLDKALPAGPWNATLTLESGLLKREATATITFPTSSGTAALPVRAKNVPLTKDRRVLIPIAAGLIGIVLIVLFVLWLLANWRSKRRKQDPAQ